MNVGRGVIASAHGANHSCPLWVRFGKSLTEHIESASPPKSGHEADMPDWRLVPEGDIWCLI